jgi:hypothetical protein
MEIVFEAEGRLRHIRLGGKRIESPGGWDQKGAVVTFDVNRYSRWSGLLRGDTMEGSASNVQGERWTWKLLRAP